MGTVDEETRSFPVQVFANFRAWFSSSVADDKRRLWERHGGTVVLDVENADYAFSDDCSCEDTRSLYGSRKFQVGQYAIFKSSWVVEASKKSAPTCFGIEKFLLLPKEALDELNIYMDRERHKKFLEDKKARNEVLSQEFVKEWSSSSTCDMRLRRTPREGINCSVVTAQSSSLASRDNSRPECTVEEVPSSQGSPPSSPALKQCRVLVSIPDGPGAAKSGRSHAGTSESLSNGKKESDPSRKETAGPCRRSKGRKLRQDAVSSVTAEGRVTVLPESAATTVAPCGVDGQEAVSRCRDHGDAGSVLSETTVRKKAYSLRRRTGSQILPDVESSDGGVAALRASKPFGGTKSDSSDLTLGKEKRTNAGKRLRQRNSDQDNPSSNVKDRLRRRKGDQDNPGSIAGCRSPTYGRSATSIVSPSPLSQVSSQESLSSKDSQKSGKRTLYKRVSDSHLGDDYVETGSRCLSTPDGGKCVAQSQLSPCEIHEILSGTCEQAVSLSGKIGCDTSSLPGWQPATRSPREDRALQLRTMKKHVEVVQHKKRGQKCVQDFAYGCFSGFSHIDDLDVPAFVMEDFIVNKNGCRVRLVPNS